MNLFNGEGSSTFKGNMGQSITCIKGVSFLKETLDISRFLTNSVNIAWFACTSTCLLWEGTRNTCRAGVASTEEATPVIAEFKAPLTESVWCCNIARF